MDAMKVTMPHWRQKVRAVLADHPDWQVDQIAEALSIVRGDIGATAAIAAIRFCIGERVGK